MTWDEIGRNVGDRIFELEQQIEDMKEASYDASFVAMGSYNTGGDGESPEGVTGSTNVLRGAVTLTPTLCRRIDGEPMVEGGSNVSDTIQVLNPYQIVKPKGTENPINIKWIDKASHDGQILILEPFYKHPTADNSSNTTTYSLVLKTAGNINISSDVTVASGGKVFLQWTENVPITNSSSGSWTIISQSSGGGGVSLSGTNTWTGTNIFSGAFSTSGTTTSLTSPNIYLGDQSTDAITITGGITSTGTNAWNGINTFSSSVSFTGATTTVGDSGNDLFTCYAKMGTSLNLNTHDISGIDRLTFSTATSSDDTLSTSDYGLEVKGGTSPTGLNISVPNNKVLEMSVNGERELQVSSSYIDVSNYDGSSSTAKRITYVATPQVSTDAVNKSYCDSQGGGWTGNATSNLDMNGNNITEIGGLDLDGSSATIQGVVNLDFYQTAHSINSLSTGMSFQIASNDKYSWIVAGSTEMELTTNLLYLAGSNISGVNDLTVNDDVYIGDDLRVVGKTDLDGNIDLGNASSDDCNMYAQLDFKNHSTSTQIQFSSLYTDGYIEIKVGGSTKRLYYGAG